MTTQPVEKETAYRKPVTPARTPHVPANLSKDAGLSGAASFVS
jgi:hypothetical protein